MAEQDASDRGERMLNQAGRRQFDRAEAAEAEVARLTKERDDYHQIDLEQDAVIVRLSEELDQVKAENERLKAFNMLDPATVERLALLLEEMGETQQVIGKILRHGYESCHPDDPLRTTNRELLTSELGDVAAAVDLMSGAGDFPAINVDLAKSYKLAKVRHYLHHQAPSA